MKAEDTKSLKLIFALSATDPNFVPFVSFC